MDFHEFHWPIKRLSNFATGMTFVCEFSSNVRFPVIFVATDAVGDSFHIFRSRNFVDRHSQSIYVIPCQENAAEESHCLKGVLMIPMCERSIFDGQSLEERVRDHTEKLPQEDSGSGMRRSRRPF
jgi:hypothetical protein